ncbi:MEDS domain-containing protein [Paenibacillus tengchongensis]|uniref:MEDS domain-containing protein n=1 Tax=Paenibacillus tengchongensis TaxID=2608684 RepID=UPI001651FD7B|nr:MEDS domain-containing protein [Paenibacillus tengchongensis]
MTSVNDGGHIIYLFEDSARYIDNAVSYIATAIEHGHHILLIEQPDTYQAISNMLEGMISPDQLHYLHYADNIDYYGCRGDFDFRHILAHFEEITASFRQEEVSIRTWANVMTWGDHDESKIRGNLMTYERHTSCVVRDFGMVSICAYNAVAISASLQTNLMREHEYVMTDQEFFKSPLYRYPTPEDVIFPSLSVQRQLLNEQKQLLIEKEAIELANQAKNEFIAMMNHEIRTPLNGVLAMAELMAATGLDSQQEDYITTIKKSGSSLLRIVNDILDYSKLESGFGQLLKEAFSVREAIAETLNLLMPSILSKNLQVYTIIDPEVPEILIGDDGRFRQVLLNLLGNAVKFTEEGSVSVLVKVLRADSAATRLQITVKDTGIGIPPEKRSQLFLPFYRVDNGITRKTEGTGLGLAICKRIVELMNGEIALGSGDAAVQGTVVLFTAEFAAYPEALHYY